MRKLPVNTRRSNGFTLLEMVLALTVFILLAAAVFGIILGVLKGTASLHDNQYQRDQIAALNDYIKKKMESIPATGMLISYQRGTGDGLAQNGVVISGGEGITIIDAMLQANGLYTLRSGYLPLEGLQVPGKPAPLPSLIPQIMNAMDHESFSWMPLIKDVKTLHWKFEDFNTGLWADKWDNGNNKPNMIEFSMQFAGDSSPTIMDFWLPPLTPVTLALPQTQTTTVHGP